MVYYEVNKWKKKKLEISTINSENHIRDTNTLCSKMQSF